MFYIKRDNDEMEKLIIGKDGFETVKYDSPDSLLYVRRSRLSRFNEMRVESHRHEDIEFNIILSGSMTYRVGSETVALSEGRGIMVNSARRHSVFGHDGKDCEFIVILMNPAFLCTTKHIEDTYVLPVTRPEARDFVELDPRVGWQSDIISKLRDIWTSYEDGRDALRIAEIFFSLWHAVYANIAPPTAAKNDRKDDELKGKRAGERRVLKEMLEYVYENYGQRITLGDIAAAGKICKSKCNELFVKYMHCPPVGFLTDYRIYKALGLLHDTEMSVLEIAYATGFSTSSYFTALFRSRLGCTPSDYRRHGRQAATEIKDPTSFSFFRPPRPDDEEQTV